MPRNDKLWQRLQDGTKTELEGLSKIIRLADAEQKSKEVLVEELSVGIRVAAGHSVRNFFRGPHDFPYKQILIDVADKLAPGLAPWSRTEHSLHDERPEEDVEATVWRFFEQKMNQRIEKLPAEAREKLRADTAEELRRLGYSEALVSQVGASVVGATAGSMIAPALAYHIALSTTSGLGWLNLWWVGHAPMAAVFGAGSWIFSALYAPALVWWLGNTAYRKTVPAVLELIKIHKLRELEKTLG